MKDNNITALTVILSVSALLVMALTVAITLVLQQGACEKRGNIWEHNRCIPANIWLQLERERQGYDVPPYY